MPKPCHHVVRASQLMPGDILTATRRTVLRRDDDGLYMRGHDDSWILPKTPFPKGKVGVRLQRKDGTVEQCYFWKTTTIGISR